LILISCSNKNKQRVLVDDVFAEGNIIEDTVFNGFIKFYDTATNKLLMTANYKSGTLNGERIDYYGNGKPKSIMNYRDGKANGELTILDSAGNIFKKQNLYYDLRVGPSLTLKKGKPSEYYFYSLENKELLHINYDSIQGKRFGTSASEERQTELFLYLPNPPGLNFAYSFCIIDNTYTVKRTVKEFNNGESWGVINLNYSNLKSGDIYAIKLTIDNEFDNDNRIATMFKKL
jgi:hypothetical protein